jgi:hypothetical protein
MKVIPETHRAHQILYLRFYQMSNYLFVVKSAYLSHASINEGIIYPIAQYEEHCDWTMDNNINCHN